MNGDQDVPTVHLGLTYDPWVPPNIWEGPTYADYLAQVERDGQQTTASAATTTPPVTVAGVKIPAVVAWGLGLAALYFVLDRSI